MSECEPLISGYVSGDQTSRRIRALISGRACQWLLFSSTFSTYEGYLNPVSGLTDP